MNHKHSKAQSPASQSRPAEQTGTALSTAIRAKPSQNSLPWPIEMVPPADLKPAKRNARVHSKKQIRQIGNSIARFGFMNPIVADEGGKIVCGHGRNEAAKKLGIKLVPVIRATHLNESELRVFALADNKTAENAGWDHNLLALEFSELGVDLQDTDLSIEDTAFDTAEIDSIFANSRETNLDPADEIPEPAAQAISSLNDVYFLDGHRLIVGDARDQNTFDRLVRSQKVDMAFHDPPYNVPINGHVGGRGRTKHPEFAYASGEMTHDKYVSFLNTTLHQANRYMKDGGISYVCMDWRHMQALFEATSNVYTELKNICVWTKTTPGQGSFYRSQHEFVCVYKTGTAPHINTFELGQHGRTRSNVWTHPGANTFRAGRMDELRMHPTVKPVAMIADAMLDCSRRGSIVLDAFAGSGSTIMAAEKVGRRAFCVEIDPIYVDTAIRRWQALTGKDAILESTGMTFSELEATRKGGRSKSSSKKIKS